MNEIDGIRFEKAKKRRVRGRYGDIKVYFIGKQDLVKNKNSTSRTKDKADVEELD